MYAQWRVFVQQSQAPGIPRSQEEACQAWSAALLTHLVHLNAQERWTLEAPVEETLIDDRFPAWHHWLMMVGPLSTLLEPKPLWKLV